MHGLQVPGFQPQLIQLREAGNEGLVHARLNETAGGVCRRERLVSFMKNSHDRNASLVGKAGTSDLGNLKDFGSGDMEGFDLLHGIIVHAGRIKGGSIERKTTMAS